MGSGEVPKAGWLTLPQWALNAWWKSLGFVRNAMERHGTLSRSVCVRKAPLRAAVNVDLTQIVSRGSGQEVMRVTFENI